MNTAFFRELVRARRGTFIVLLVFIVSDIGLYGYRAFYQEPRLAQMQQSWFAKRQGAGEHRDRAAVYQQGTKDLVAWQGRIAPKRDFVRFIGSMFEMASRSGLAVGSVTYRPIQPKGEALTAFVIQLSVSGRYGAAKSFIAELQRSRDIFTIDTMNFSRQKPTDDTVDLKLQLTAYFRTEGA